MKTFTDFLMSCEKTYEFKIKIAGCEMNNEDQDRLEHALKSFDLDSISKPKRMPNIGVSLDFPALGACDVHLVNITTKMPVTDEQLRAAISNQGRFPMANVIVVPKNSPEEMRRDEEATAREADGDILTKDLEKGECGQELVGTTRLERMMKALETTKTEFAVKTKTPAPKTSNDSPQNNKGPVAKKGAK